MQLHADQPGRMVTHLQPMHAMQRDQGFVLGRCGQGRTRFTEADVIDTAAMVPQAAFHAHCGQCRHISSLVESKRRAIKASFAVLQRLEHRS